MSLSAAGLLAGLALLAASITALVWIASPLSRPWLPRATRLLLLTEKRDDAQDHLDRWEWSMQRGDRRLAREHIANLTAKIERLTDA